MNGVLNLPIRVGGGVKVVRATAQSIGNGTVTPISFSSAISDPLGFWSAGSPTRLTVPASVVGRLILLSGLFDFATLTAGTLGSILIRKNGSTLLTDFPQNPGTANHLAFSATITDVPASSDYYEMCAYENSGTVNVQVTNFQPQFSIAVI